MGQLVQQADPGLSAVAYPDDYILAHRVLLGDLWAWNLLYDTAHPIVSRFVRKQRVCAEQEIVVDAFEIGYRSIGKYQGNGKFSAWICGIAKHLILKQYEGHSRDQRLIERMRLFCPCYDNIDPLRLLIRKERDRHLWAAFHSLTEDQKRLIEWRVFYHESYNQIASRLQMKRSECMKAYARAICLLKSRFLALSSGKLRPSKNQVLSV